MKPTVFRYGIYATIAIVALSAVHFFLVVPNVSWANAEVAGYLTMLLSMVFVFAGIKHYRDKINNGNLSFSQGLKIGALIVLIPAVAFGLFDLLYTEVINPGWMDEYYNTMTKKLKSSTAPEKLEAALKKMQDEKEMFSNPVFQFLLMALTVFIIGFIVTIISSLTLRRNNTAAA
jgi:uncharacterized membrane protein (DUF106 family)